jgi:lysophospholipase L1-like esterase
MGPVVRVTRARFFLLSVALAAGATAFGPAASGAAAGPAAGGDRADTTWIGTWAASPQAGLPGPPTVYRNQSLRLVVHVSVGGARIRIKLANTFGTKPLVIGGARVARRTTAAEIDPASDRALAFHGQASTAVPAGSMVESDPVDLAVPALSDLAISLFFPERAEVTTAHILANQTSYVSAESGDVTAAASSPGAKTIKSWPFLTGVDVAAPPRGATIVAFGSSLTDGDGTTADTNARWPDVLAARLQKRAGPKAELGVLNAGIIGNRLLSDSPEETFGGALGQAGLTRFERDVLGQAGVKFIVVGLGINDIAFPGSLSPATEPMTAERVIAGYRQLIERAHRKGVRVIGTTNPPFEDSFLKSPPVTFYTPEKERVRQEVNDWIRAGGAFDGVVDLDAVLRDPSRPTRLLPRYDSGDHVHPNDAGCLAEGNAFPLTLFER